MDVEDYLERKPKIECGFTQSGELSNTCDMPNPVDDNTSAIKIEPESNNYCEDDGGTKSGTKVNEETRNGENRSNSDTRTRLRDRMIPNNQDHSGIGSSKPKRTGLKKISYCEDTSSEASDSDNECHLRPPKKCTKTSEKVSLEIPEIPSSLPVIKLEPSSVDTRETNEQLSKCFENVVEPILKDVTAKGSKNKRKVIKKKMKEISFEDVLKVVKSNYGNKSYTLNRSIISEFEKYLIYRCRICTIEFDNIELVRDHFEKEHSNSGAEFINKEMDKFNKLYKCDHCGKTVRFLRDFVKHLDSSHNGEEVRYSCDRCNSFTTFDKYLFSSHVKSHLCPKKKTECHFCHLSFVQIKKHLKRKHSESTIKCPLCPKTCTTVEYMRQHRNEVHPDETEKVVCKDCSKEFKNVISLRRHIRSVHYEIEPRFECHICKNKYKTMKSLHFHMRNHHVTQVQPSSVDTRGPNEPEPVSKYSEEVLKLIQDVQIEGMVSYKTQVVRRKSVKKEFKPTFEEARKILQTGPVKNFYKRKRNRPIIEACEAGCEKYLIYRCWVCANDFDSFELANDHFEKEHDPKTEAYTDKHKFDKLYKCDRCAKTLHIVRIFLKHLDSCHNDKQEQEYSCDKCVFTTLEKFRFTSHLKSHIRPKKHNGEKIECHFCHLSFTNIKRHLQNVHFERKIKCPLCPKTFGLMSEVRRHHTSLHARLNNFVCKECGKELKDSRTYKFHLRTHYKTGRFECNLCKRTLKTKNTFDNHMSRLHGFASRKLLTCSDCGRCYQTSDALLNHIRRKHDPNCEVEEPKKNHLCETCGKSFIEKQTLERHMVVHTKEKKFVCATCNKGFTQLDSLKSHQVVHTGIKPFVCGKCGNKYSQKYPLTLHIRKHHPE